MKAVIFRKILFSTIIFIFSFTSILCKTNKANLEKEYNKLWLDLKNTNTPGYKSKLHIDSKNTYSQGSLFVTKIPTDIAISGKGYFKIQLTDNTYAYTRDGSFVIDSSKTITTQSGYALIPKITFPENYIRHSIKINERGVISCKIASKKSSRIIGQIKLFKPGENSKITKIIDDRYYIFKNSKIIKEGNPASHEYGRIIHRVIEMSTVMFQKTAVRMIFILEELKSCYPKKINRINTKIYLLKNIIEVSNSPERFTSKEYFQYSIRTFEQYIDFLHFDYE